MSHKRGGSDTRTPKQEHAYYEVWKRRKTGKLDKPEGHRCSSCGGAASESHHSDYSRGGSVKFMCASCNRKRGKGRNA